MLSIDITDKQLKLVRGGLNGQKIRVLEVETRDLAPGSISNGYITDIPMVAGEITDIIATRNIKEKEAIVCVNSGSILYKELAVPKPKKISNSAAIESMILTTMGITKEYNISYSIIGEGKDENDQPTLQLIATACPQRLVDGYIRLFTQLGIKLNQINVSNNCITRLILNTPKLDASMPLMLVQIDNDFININLYEDGQVTLSRYVRIDPYDFNNDEDYVNQAVYDNVFRTLQFTSQRPGTKPLKEIMFYGQVKDFIALSNAVASFNVPSHILSIPSNIVTFCDFDFAEYANAIGAFFKVRKDYDHVNLLDASAVKEKKGTSGFVILLGICAVAAAALVGGATLVCNGIATAKQAEGDAIDHEIHNEEIDAKIALLNEKNDILDGISRYGSNLLQADTLFEYRPKGIKKIRDMLVEIQDKYERTLVVDDIEVAGYNVSVTFITYDLDTPTNFVRDLIAQDYFEAIEYTGFRGEKIEIREVQQNSSIVQNQTDESKYLGVIDQEDGEYRYEVSLTMRIRGGNGYEAE